MSWKRIGAAAAGLTLLGLGVGESVADAEAGWIPVSTDEVVPACPGFAVRAVTEGRFRLDFGDDGIRVTFAENFSTFTNVETGASIRLGTMGTFWATFDATGTEHIRARGHLVIGGPLIGLLLFNGQVELLETPDGLLSVTGSTGRVTDICSLID